MDAECTVNKKPQCLAQQAKLGTQKQSSVSTQAHKLIYAELMRPHVCWGLSAWWTHLSSPSQRQHLCESAYTYTTVPPVAHARPLQANTLIVSHPAIPLRPAPWQTVLVSPSESSTNRPCSSGLRWNSSNRVNYKFLCNYLPHSLKLYWEMYNDHWSSEDINT